MAATIIATTQAAASGLPELKKTCTVEGKLLRYKLISQPNGTGYQGELRIADRLSKKTHAYHPVRVQWQAGLTAATFNELRNAGDIQITVIPVALTPAPKDKKRDVRDFKDLFCISIKRLPSTLPEQPTAEFTSEQLLERKLHYVFFESTRDLVVAFKCTPRDAILNNIITEMVDTFTTQNGRSIVIAEMVALIPILKDEDSFLVVNTLINEIYSNPIDKIFSLNGLVDILRTYLRSTFKQLVSQLKSEKDTPEIPSQVLSPTTLVGIANVLLNKIKECTTAESKIGEEPMGVVYLKAFVSVLEVMEMTGLKQLERKTYHKPFYNLLVKHDYVANLKEAYLAALGKQLLAQIPNNETKLHAFARHCYYFGQTCLLLYKAYSDKSLSALGEAGKSFLKTFHMQEGEADWYVTLFSLEYALKTYGTDFLKSFRYLVQWAEVGHHESKKVLERLHTHNPFFIFGLVQALQKFIDSQAGLDPEAYWLAFFFLEKIGKDNGPNEGIFTVEMNIKRKAERLFKQVLPDYALKGATAKAESYSKQVRQEIMGILKHYVCHHSLASIRDLALASYRQFSVEKLPPYTPNEPLSNLLQAATDKKATWAAAFKTEYTSIAKDEQLEQEERYYIQLEVKDQSDGVVDDLHTFLRKFLRSTNTVILFTGPAGSGKSLSIKHFVKQSWEKGLPDGYIPIVVSLATLQDPTQAVTRKLADLSLNINNIRNLPILWIFDGEDESKESAATTRRLYSLMQLNLWENSKVVFIARSGMSDDKIASFSPKEGSTDGLIHLDALAFNITKRNQYFAQFSTIRKLERENAEKTGIVDSEKAVPSFDWEDPKTYIKFLDSNPSLFDIIGTPLYLSLTAKVLPHIIERRIKEQSNPDAQLYKTDLLDAFYCSTMAREIRKRKVANSGWQEKGAKMAYFRYALQVVKYIKQYEIENKLDTDNPWMPKELAESKYPEYFDENNYDLVMKRRCCCLTLKDNCYGYSHATFYAYFFTLTGNSSEVKRLLKENIYQHTF